MKAAKDVTVKIGKASVSMAANDVMEIMLAEINKHPDDQAVNTFAAAMREKMKFAREVKGRTGWNDMEQCSKEHLHELLLQQLTSKGDTVDLANFAMMLHQRNERIDSRLVNAMLYIGNAQQKTNLPCIGTMWPAQGGIYAGLMRGYNGEKDYHLIIAPDDLGSFKDVKWGCAGKKIKDADSDGDGMINTKAMAENGSDLAKQILALEIDGHKDWYLPARKEARMCYVNCQDQFVQSDWYWTSTQNSSDYAYVQFFEDGFQYGDPKVNTSRARAVRRLSVI